MTVSLTSVMLAGTLRPTPLREALDIHVLCLPMGSGHTLLDIWRSKLAEIDGLNEVRIMVNTTQDADSVDRVAKQSSLQDSEHLSLHITAEGTSWRGAGGILHDVTENLLPETIVLCVEANTLPPVSLAPLLEPLIEQQAEALDGVVGINDIDEPAGVYAFTRRAIELIPSIGFHDIKEQFLPEVHQQDLKVVTARLGERTIRMWDRKGYLTGVRQNLEAILNDTTKQSVSSEVKVSDSALIDGCCIIQPEVVIQDDAVVHDSVVLSGAKIEKGAIVSRSIIGPSATISSNDRVVRQVIASPAPRENSKASTSKKVKTHQKV